MTSGPSPESPPIGEMGWGRNHHVVAYGSLFCPYNGPLEHDIHSNMTVFALAPCLSVCDEVIGASAQSTPLTMPVCPRD
jgi:hypothetical protein